MRLSSSYTHIHSIGIPEGKGKGKRTKRICEEIMTKNVPNSGSSISLQQDKLKEILTQTHEKQSAEKKRPREGCPGVSQGDRWVSELATLKPEESAHMREENERERDAFLLTPWSRGPSSRACEERRSDAPELRSSPGHCSAELLVVDLSVHSWMQDPCAFPHLIPVPSGHCPHFYR